MCLVFCLDVTWAAPDDVMLRAVTCLSTAPGQIPQYRQSHLSVPAILKQFYFFSKLHPKQKAYIMYVAAKNEHN